eukprot:CAMPEP_0194705652 /NCGR_PEP_ID=MMETSP0295-20121207/29082_1 /TAXON_ID=39354 /ORGANISM="Heterosigma akashiwo, Strain CCMP2393" /LENGTH=81 /DNA_ID=CAMNT_0039601421 /DNA_START=186 /DNA_END=428 /DNA_ORIENTATION=+
MTSAFVVMYCGGFESRSRIRSTLVTMGRWKTGTKLEVSPWKFKQSPGAARTPHRHQHVPEGDGHGVAVHGHEAGRAVHHQA